MGKSGYKEASWEVPIDGIQLDLYPFSEGGSWICGKSERIEMGICE